MKESPNANHNMGNKGYSTESNVGYGKARPHTGIRISMLTGLPYSRFAFLNEYHEGRTPKAGVGLRT